MSLPQPILDDMPLHIKSQIFRDIPARQKMRCRRVAYSMKTAIDNSSTFVKTLKISLYPQYRTAEIFTTVANTLIIRKTIRQEGKDVHVTPNNNKKITKIIADSDFFDVVMERINLVLKVPFVKFDELTIEFHNGELEFQDRILASLPKEIRCRSLDLMLLREECTSRFQQFLSLINPKDLEHLNLATSWSTIRESSDMGWLMPEFKNLKCLKIKFSCDGIRLDDVEHLEECHLVSTDFTVKEIDRLKRMCIENGRLNFDLVCEGVTMEDLLFKFGPPTKRSQKIWHFENKKGDKRFKIKAYHEQHYYGPTYGCIISMNKLKINRRK